MFRVFLLLVTVSVVLVITGWPGSLFEHGHPNGRLVSTTGRHPGSSILDSPTITVLSAPRSLGVNETGAVQVQAQAPAAAGDKMLLDTAGALNLGYSQVSQGVLDDHLQATLLVSGRNYTGAYNYWARMPATGTYQEGKSATFAITFATAAPPPQSHPSCGGVTPTKPNGQPWVCTYDDEFNGTTLDRHYWVPQTGGTTSGTGTTIACTVDSPDTIAVAGGFLDLSLVQLPATRKCTRNKSSQYAYGEVMHYQTFSQTYGKYEIRAKIPDVQVPGIQESFWLWPKKNSYGPWPASGEIDFAELYSNKPNLDRPYLHYLPGTTTAGTNDNVTNNNCAIKPGEFNTYGVEWEPKQIKVLLNNQVCFTDDYSSATASFQGANSPFDKPFYLSLDQAMGTIGNVYDTTTIPDKVTTQIDYVRIWQ